MQYILITGIALCFLGILVLNIYFRMKVLKNYRFLVQNKVEFNANYLLNRQKLEQEVIPHYPDFRNEILGFSDNLRFSMKCASGLIILITIFAAFLMFFK